MTAIDPALAARIAAAEQPSTDQTLINDLAAALTTAYQQLDAAVAAGGDPAILAALNKQIADLTTQLATANAALTADQQTLATQMAADAAKISDLTAQLKTATDALAAAQAQIAQDATTAAGLQAQIDTLTKQLADATAQAASLSQQFTAATQQLSADQVTLAQIKAADAATIAGLNQTVAAANTTITNLQAQLAAALAQIPPPPPVQVNHPPVWQSIPNITFTFGVPATVSIAGYVSDPDNDPLTITKNAVALPQGVTYDAPNKRFVYDGVGALSPIVGGQVLTADDGKP